MTNAADCSAKISELARKIIVFADAYFSVIYKKVTTFLVDDENNPVSSLEKRNSG